MVLVSDSSIVFRDANHMKDYLDQMKKNKLLIADMKAYLSNAITTEIRFQ